MESKRFIRQDLKIFRGTAKECEEKQKEGLVQNLEIYLAWDSGEIFVGNKQGALVRYGGGTGAIEREIAKEFDIFKGNLNEEITAKAQTAINSVIDSTLASIRSEFTQRISTTVTNLTDLVDTKIASISSAIGTIENLNENLTLVNNRFDNYYTKNQLYTKNEVESAISDATDILDTKITTTRTNLETLTEQVTTVASDLNTVETDLASVKENYATKEYVDNSHPILYLAGSEMQNLGVNSYRLVFCTQNGNGYIAGTLYYFDPNQNQFRMISGGSSTPQTKTNCTTTFGLEYSVNGQNVSGNSFYEIGSENLSVIITGRYTNAQIGGAVDGSAKISKYFNGQFQNDILSILVNNQQTSGSAISAIQQFSRNTIGYYSIKISATAKTETEDTIYTITNNNLERKITIYQPVLLGDDGNFEHYRTHVGKFTLNANQHYYIYIPTTENINDIILSGFSYDYGEPENVSMNINGIENVSYKRYDLHTPSSSIQITIS